MSDSNAYFVVTALVDDGAKPASVTRNHGDAYEIARDATEAPFGSLELVELPVSSVVFAALRRHLGLPETTTALYDLFPLAPHLSPEVRHVAAQFLAAELAWSIEEQGHLGGLPLNLRLDLPKGWERDPKAVHEKLMAAGALELGAEAIERFRRAKATFTERRAALGTAPATPNAA
jgi:hypothetical protein